MFKVKTRKFNRIAQCQPYGGAYEADDAVMTEMMKVDEMVNSCDYIKDKTGYFDSQDY